ncbi:hypothetical protein AwErysi_08930 [Erysipelotrichaceae bacterium]|nr:hypothetical protein AwErysi_08930 [Erysipelotrichaceae bacterium]
MDYKDLGQQILPLIGGKENIKSFTNCMTRLRINILDESLVKGAEIKALKGVLGVVEGEQLQIIVGPGHAQRACDAFQEVTGMSANTENNSNPSNIAEDMKAKVKAK